MVRRGLGVLAATVAGLLPLAGCGLLGSDSSNANSGPQRPHVPQVVNYRITQPEWVANRNHEYGHISYPTSPPVGGNHNPLWQDCEGEIYAAPIANEHAVHSLEHGAVWVTYRPDLPGDQIRELEDLVRDRPFMMMSPYPNMDAKISLQAWGYQLKVDSADDPSILAFIRAYRMTASMEPAAGCSGGVTDADRNVLLGP
jgi:Protein of unknown function (DUF3105)